VAKSNTQTTKVVNPELARSAFAKAVCDGDVVNLRFLLGPYSPARPSTSERFESDKYAYLLPDAEAADSSAYREADREIGQQGLWPQIEAELMAERPAQIPAELLLPLADNAVRQHKYTSAAQAYEMLRIRKRMQDEFFQHGESLLDAGDVAGAVRAFRAATGMAYNYAAFPEPLPVVADYHSRALMLHAEYPQTPEDGIAVRPVELFLLEALAYLLHDGEAAARVVKRPQETQVAFLQTLIRAIDPHWDAFAARYREACEMAHRFGGRLEEWAARPGGARLSLEEEIAEQFGEDPSNIAATLLGRVIEDGEWWQYIKELAYAHPAGVLFVSRHAVSELELIVPRYRSDSPVVQALGLVAETPV
jgi:hypothetical protein